MRPDVPNPPSRRRAMKSKDRAAWCRSKVGTPHDYQIVKREAGGHTGACGRPNGVDTPEHYWLCMHDEVCANCGRVRMLKGREQCPDYPR